MREISLLDPERENDGYQAQVKIRGGAIVPLGKVIQNTGENSLNPLTLLVCLDDGGNASGDLYEDAGDGFGYQKSQYVLTHYVAHREGDSVLVKIEKRTGDQAVPERVIQVRVITDDGILEGSGPEAKEIRIEKK